ncbi:MAG: SAM-dependent methyltransferase, partial [Belnapia sp.]|nr:SAM-dependent methyltransferase [Belnapia sp.]
MDEGRLNEFIGKMLGDLGGASSVPMVRMGDTLGLYRTLHAEGPMTCGALAEKAKVHERYLREWLSFNAA